MRNETATSANGFPLHQVDSRPTARIPIVIFKDSGSGLECDISVMNPLAVRNTRLLKVIGAASGGAVAPPARCCCVPLLLAVASGRRGNGLVFCAHVRLFVVLRAPGGGDGRAKQPRRWSGCFD